MHVEQNGVRPVRVEIGGAHDPGIDLVGPVRARYGELLPTEPVSGHVGEAAVDAIDREPQLAAVLDGRTRRGDDAVADVEPLDRDGAGGESFGISLIDTESEEMGFAAILGGCEQTCRPTPRRAPAGTPSRRTSGRARC